MLKNTRFDMPKLPIASILDHLRDSGQIEFVIVEDKELPHEYAVSTPRDRTIIVRESVYHNAINGIPRDCFTLAHELGHLLLHTDTNPTYARSQTPSNHHFTEDAEWQANTFASELLVDCRLTSGMKNPREIAEVFGVSMEAAGYVYERYKKSGVL